MNFSKVAKPLGILVAAHLLAFVIMQVYDADAKGYAYEHGYYYFVLLILSGVIFAQYANKDKLGYSSMLRYFKNPTNIVIMLLIVVSGYMFQKLPDIDQTIPIFFGHRSPLTHSVVFIWLFWWTFRRGKFLGWVTNKTNIDVNLANNKWVKSVFLALAIGIASHLMVDIAYMFAISPALFLVKHKGHGAITIIPTGLEVPYILFMAISSFLYLIHLLKGGIMKSLELNPFKSYSLLYKSASKGEFTFYTFLAVSLLINIGRDFRRSGDFYFELWVLVFVSLIVWSFWKRKKNGWKKIN